MRYLVAAIFTLLYSFTSFANNPSLFELTSSSFTSLGAIPLQYTCDGKDISPQLKWSGAPKNTEIFALILSDPDAPGGTFYHWALYNIPKTTNVLAEATNQFNTAKNSWNKAQYNGPCPPKNALHHYVFTLYALDINIPPLTQNDVSSLLEVMQQHIVGTAQLIATFQH
ncbi:MAG: YbhB/YbcL family Raf kinase inhibitor-like protein [Gammaproteobacteria bacterium]